MTFKPSLAHAQTLRTAVSLLVHGAVLATPVAIPMVAWGESSTFNIPAQPLPAALKVFADQANMQLFYVYNSVKDMQANPVHGEQDKHAALNTLLRGTKLQVVFNSNDSATIHPADTHATTRRTVAATSPKQATPEPVSILEEIVVTATRREESLSKVPLSILATSQEALDKQGVRSVDDLMRLTPSITFGQDSQTFGTGQTSIAIRGIQSASGIPTTGIYIDDTPIQTRTGVSPSLGNAYPEIFDLDRVEVLRGPQGTLFGTGSVGGAVRFITPDPAFGKSSLYARSEVSSTEHGGISYEAGVAGGTPIIEDVLGLRASVWHRHDAGYVDRLDRVSKQRVQKDINSGDSNSARVALGWKPSDALTITPSIFFQHTRQNDSPRFEVATSDLHDEQFNTSLPIRQQWHWDRFYMPALKIGVDFDAVKLISNTSYFTRKSRTESDDSTLSIGVFGGYPGPFPAELSDYSSGTHSKVTQTNLTQELRLQSTNTDSRWNWVTGAFFAHAITHDNFAGEDPQLLRAINYGEQQRGDPLSASISDVFGVDLYQGVYSVLQNLAYKDIQQSLFGQVDYQIIAGLKATGGVRFTSNKFSYGSFIAGPLYATEGTSFYKEVKTNTVTPKAGLSWQADDNNLYYFNAAKGSRGPGIADAVGSGCADDAAAIGFDPLNARDIKGDSVWSYEIGSKNNFNNRLSLDISAYRIDWKDVQTTLTLPGCQVITTLNLGRARSEGADLSLMAVPVRGLTLGLGVSYIDSRYTTDMIALVKDPSNPTDPGQLQVIRRHGEPLPVAPWSFHISGEYDFSVGSREAYARADYTHSTHNSKALDISSPLVDADIPRPLAASNLDLRSGIKFGNYDISLFVDNVLNDHPLLSLVHDARGSVNFTSTTYRPRTAGITLTLRR